jgi:hypothetical protein
MRMSDGLWSFRLRHFKQERLRVEEARATDQGDLPAAFRTAEELRRLEQRDLEGYDRAHPLSVPYSDRYREERGLRRESNHEDEDEAE